MKTTGVSSQQQTGVTDSKKIPKPETKGKGQKEFKSVLDEKTSEKPAGPKPGREKTSDTRSGMRAVREDTSETGTMRAVHERPEGDIAQKKQTKFGQLADKKDAKAAEKKELKQFLSERKETKKEVHEKSDLPKEEQKPKEDKELTRPTPILMGPSTVQSQIATQKLAEQKTVLNIKEIESIVDRVQVGVNEKGMPEFNFDLNTQNLGPMNLKITQDKEGIKIQFVMQNASAQKTLENNIGDLTKALADKGMNLAGAQFTTRAPSTSQSGSESSSDDRGGHDPGAGGGRRRRVERKKSEDDEDYTI